MPAETAVYNRIHSNLPAFSSLLKSDGFGLRVAMLAAVLSICFENAIEIHLLNVEARTGPSHYIAVSLSVLTSLAVLSRRYSRWAVSVAALCLVPFVLDQWPSYANHQWLAVWTIPAAAFFPQWWESQAYARYIRLTLALVMIAAGAQKVIAGTYVDGSIIAFLSYEGVTTERMFRGLCDAQTLQEPCNWHVALSNFILLWQFAVGFLLLTGFRNIWFLAVEISFLLGAGVFADELNFQVLNIGLLCIAFGIQMKTWLFGICVLFLVIDYFSLSMIIDAAVQL